MLFYASSSRVFRFLHPLMECLSFSFFKSIHYLHTRPFSRRAQLMPLHVYLKFARSCTSCQNCEDHCLELISVNICVCASLERSHWMNFLKFRVTPAHIGGRFTSIHVFIISDQERNTMLCGQSNFRDGLVMCRSNNLHLLMPACSITPSIFDLGQFDLKRLFWRLVIPSLRPHSEIHARRCVCPNIVHRFRSINKLLHGECVFFKTFSNIVFERRSKQPTTH